MEKETSEGQRFPSDARPTPKLLRARGIRAVIPAGLRSRERSGGAGGSEPWPRSAPRLRTPSAGRRGSRRESRADLPAGESLLSSPPLPSGFRGGLRRCPPARPRTLSFHPRLPTSPRVTGGSSAHPRVFPLRIGGGYAAGDGRKAPTSQPLLNPSSGDRSGQPERVKEKGFVTAEKREKAQGEERREGSKRGLMLKSIDTGWEGNHLETELPRELKRAAVCPSSHPAAIPRCFAPAHPQQCREVGTHLGKVCRVAGVRCGVVRCAARTMQTRGES